MTVWRIFPGILKILFGKYDKPLLFYSLTFPGPSGQLTELIGGVRSHDRSPGSILLEIPNTFLLVGRCGWLARRRLFFSFSGKEEDLHYVLGQPTSANTVHVQTRDGA
jgi:hypothetical protein